MSCPTKNTGLYRTLQDMTGHYRTYRTLQDFTGFTGCGNYGCHPFNNCCLAASRTVTRSCYRSSYPQRRPSSENRWHDRPVRSPTNGHPPPAQSSQANVSVETSLTSTPTHQTLLPFGGFDLFIYMSRIYDFLLRFEKKELKNALPYTL